MIEATVVIFLFISNVVWLNVALFEYRSMEHSGCDGDSPEIAHVLLAGTVQWFGGNLVLRSSTSLASYASSSNGFDDFTLWDSL